MANEAILMFETELAIPINVVDGAGIEKGTVLQLADLFIGSASSAADQAFGGITKIEKIANDGKVTIKVYMGGIFKGVAGAAITVGAALMTDATANKIETATTGTGASGIGYALEAPSGDGQTFMFRLQIGGSVS